MLKGKRLLAFCTLLLLAALCLPAAQAAISFNPPGVAAVGIGMPRTGDRNRPEIWLGLLGVSAAGLGAAAVLARKSKKNKKKENSNSDSSGRNRRSSRR